MVCANGGFLSHTVQLEGAEKAHALKDMQYMGQYNMFKSKA